MNKKYREARPRLTPGKNDPSADIVFTPRPLAVAILNSLPLSGAVLDPCRGDGAFYDNIPKSCASEWCEISQGRDFFDFHRHVDWVVSNPPWSKQRDFARHAYSIADNVAFLNSINCDIGYTARLRDMREAGFGIKRVTTLSKYPSEWKSSGFQLGFVWKQRGWKGKTEWTHFNTNNYE